jgi:hypothetical protein
MIAVMELVPHLRLRPVSSWAVAFSTAQVNNIRWAVSRVSIVKSEPDDWARDGLRNVGTL